VTLSDEKVEQPRYQSVHLVPSYRTGTPGEAEALEVLGFLLGGGQSSLLFTTLVMDEKIAVAAGAYYMGTALDDTRFFVYAIPVPGVSLEQLEHRITALIEGLTTEGFSEAALTRAKTRLVAEAIYARDSQTTLANWYGASLATGMTLADIAAWPDRIEAVTAAQVVDALRYLDNRKAVAGYLLPAEAA
jgi:zinc protease